MMKRYVFLSYPLESKTPLYQGTAPFQKERVKSIDRGDSSNGFLLSFSNHSGTHIDCPWHFDVKGKKVSDYSPEDFVYNNPLILEIAKGIDSPITTKDLESTAKVKDSGSYDLVLLRTGFSSHRLDSLIYSKKNPYLLPEAALWLKDKFSGIRALGIDCISVSSPLHRAEGRKTHMLLLGSDKDNKPVLIIEDMKIPQDIRELSQVIVSPFIMDEIDASPVAVIGVTDD